MNPMKKKNLKNNMLLPAMIGATVNEQKASEGTMESIKKGII